MGRGHSGQAQPGAHLQGAIRPRPAWSSPAGVSGTVLTMSSRATCSPRGRGRTEACTAVPVILHLLDIIVRISGLLVCVPLLSFHFSSILFLLHFAKVSVYIGD